MEHLIQGLNRMALNQNALGIHYTRNDDVLREDDLVCVDAGGVGFVPLYSTVDVTLTNV